jgi:ribosomal-protein-alanine N-acetyltransferase
MAFLKSGIGNEYSPLIRGRGVWLRPPQMGDYAEWAQLRALSRAHLTPWEPQWARDELSRTAYRRRLRHYQREQREDQGYAFFIFRPLDDELLGGLTLSNVRRGVSQSASLGYWLGLTHLRHGYMTEAVRAMLATAFDELRLHRVEAACMPANAASIGVLERNGFRQEGIARSFLKINGQWQDHLLFARLSDDARPTETLAT